MKEGEDTTNLQLTLLKLVHRIVHYEHLKFECKIAKYSQISKWYVYFWFWTFYSKNFKFLPIVYSLKSIF